MDNFSESKAVPVHSNTKTTHTKHTMASSVSTYILKPVSHPSKYENCVKIIQVPKIRTFPVHRASSYVGNNLAVWYPFQIKTGLGLLANLHEIFLVFLSLSR